jgi:IS605 OrfB family transposase
MSTQIEDEAFHGELTVHRTASLKLHNPSRRKRDIIEYAFNEYTTTYRQLLEWAQQTDLQSQVIQVNEQGRLRGATEKAIAGMLRLSGVKPNVHGSLADALYSDVAGALLSYYKLRHEYESDQVEYDVAKAQHELETPDQPFKRKPPHPPSFPVSRDPRPGAFEDALDIIGETTDVEEEEWLERQSRLIRLQRGRFMPVYFSRPDGVPNNRNFSLLVDEEQGKYYGLLFLLPDKHEWGQAIETSGNLRRIGHAATAEPPYPVEVFSSRSKCAILCPLELGDWHVQDFLANPCANPRSAFLIERNGEYFLNVTFEFTVPAIEPRAVLGVERGIAQFIALRLLDFDRNVIHEETWSGDEFMQLQWDIKKTIQRLQKRGKVVTGLTRISRISEHTVHQLANAIVDLAVQYDAQVVLENLEYFDRQKTGSTKLRAAPYQRIATVLEYKLPMHGLPAPAYVAPAYTSTMCSRCSYGDNDNRPDQATFVCQECGYEDHADLNAATNIALRWLVRQNGEDWWPYNVPSTKKR